MAKKIVAPQETDVLAVDMVAVDAVVPQPIEQAVAVCQQVDTVTVVMVQAQEPAVVQEPEKVDIQSLASCVFSVEIVDVNNKLTPKGAVKDVTELKIYVESKPEYLITIVAYSGIIYSVEAHDFDGELIYKSPKSSIGDVCDWLMAYAKINQVMAKPLKKFIIATRKLALATLPKLETGVAVCEQ